MEEAWELDLRFKMATRLFQSSRFENDCPQADSVAGLDLQPREVPWSRVADGVYSRPCVADHFDRYDNHSFGHVGYPRYSPKRHLCNIIAP